LKGKTKMSNNIYTNSNTSVSPITNTSYCPNTAGILSNPVPSFNMTNFGNFHSSTLEFKLFKAQNGFILEVGNDINYTDMVNGSRVPKKDLYIINDMENMGEKITQILSLHLLSKD